MIDTVKDAVTQVRELILPKQYFAWQTILMLSLFSWGMAYVAQGTQATGLTVQLLSTGSWLFLTIAIWWALVDNPIKILNVSISSWITGAVICVFVFSPWTDSRVQWAIASWPLISVGVASLPNFVNWNLDWRLPKPQVRQELILMLLINLLLSCWVLFYFRIQNWFESYPSLLVEDLNQGHFVYQFRGGRTRLSQGVPLLENAAATLSQELNGVPWPRVERWLLNIDEGIRTIAGSVDMIAPAERIFWSLDAPNPTEAANGYQLKLRANWLGPTAEQNGYYLEKICAITPQRNQPRITTSDQPTDGQQDLTPIARVDCASGATKVLREPSPTSG
jgi:hypothetical protein